MHRFMEGKTAAGLGMSVGTMLVGWILVVVRGPDGVAVLLLLGSWLLAHRRERQTTTILSGMLLVAGISSGLAIWPWGCAAAALMVCGGLLMPKPSHNGDLVIAISVSAALLAVLAVFSSLTGPLNERLIIPVILTAGWWMVPRLVTIEHGRRVLRMTGVPIALAFLVWLFMTAAGTGGRALERRAYTLLDEVARYETPGEALGTLNEAVSAFPWSPLVWAELGAVHRELGQTEKAFDAFEKGYAIRPGKENPCLWGVVETARTLGKTHILARFIERDVISGELAGRMARFQVAVELWRRGDPTTALEIMQAAPTDTKREREVFGWLASAAGEDSMAISTLEPIVAAGEATGETIYRLAMAYDAQGLGLKRRELLDGWCPRFPHHLGLRSWCNGSVLDSCAERLQGDGLLLGNAVRLVGWEASPEPARAGETLTVRTCWIATKPLRDMVIILHLDLGSPPRWRLNEDHAPLRGRLPTSTWPVGELVSDMAQVPLPDDAPDGLYRVFTGLWVPGEEESRLRPEGAAADLIPRGEKRIPLGTIEVVR